MLADVDPAGGQPSASSTSSCFFAAVTACSSVVSCNCAAVTSASACWRLELFVAWSAAVGPASAAARALSACASVACEASSEASAVVGSSFAITWPARTWSPTATYTSLSVPLVPKSAEADVATLTFPDALTLDWTVPYATVAVRCAAELDVVPPRNP